MELLDLALLHANSLIANSQFRGFYLNYDLTSDTSTVKISLNMLTGHEVGQIVFSIYDNVQLSLVPEEPTELVNVVFIDYTTVDPQYRGYKLSRILLLPVLLIAKTLHSHVASMDTATVNRYESLLFEQIDGEIILEQSAGDVAGDVAEDVAEDTEDFNTILFPNALDQSIMILANKIRNPTGL